VRRRRTAVAAAGPSGELTGAPVAALPVPEAKPKRVRKAVPKADAPAEPAAAKAPAKPKKEAAAKKSAAKKKPPARKKTTAARAPRKKT